MARYRPRPPDRNVALHKICEHCRDGYSPKSNRQRFCSPVCAILGRIRIDDRGCWIWQGAFLNGGYGTVSIDGISATAHKLSYMAFHGGQQIPDGIHVCHRCDVRACVNPAHLFLGTQFDNMSDCAKKGRNTRKLTEQEVIEIRSAVGVSKAELGRRYGVTDAMIGTIIRRRWWKDVGVVEPHDLPLLNASKSLIE